MIQLLDISISSKAKAPLQLRPAKGEWLTTRKFDDGSIEQIDHWGRKRRGLMVRCVECEQLCLPQQFLRSADQKGPKICDYCWMVLRRRQILAERQAKVEMRKAKNVLAVGRPDCTSAERRAAMIFLASPAWRDREAIREVYDEAKRISRESGEQYEVDHIFPIQGQIACGLHVHWNLQVIKASSNRSKNNDFPMEESPAWSGFEYSELNEYVREIWKLCP